ncbi:MAG: hypothetical protein GY940_35850, partial [bacterium]|nr:hypothetical protein [bacterium]
LLKRHEALRTAFLSIHGEPVQEVCENLYIKIAYFDLETSTALTANDIIDRFVRPFDLTEAPLLRIGLAKLGTHRHLLLLDIHHIISDGTATGIIVDDFTRLYKNQKLAQLPIQYKDYSLWQQNILAAGEFKIAENYWLNRFNDEIPVLNLPTDYPRPDIQSSEGTHIHFQIDRDLTAKINELSRQTGATLYMILLAAYNVLLARYTGQDD